MRRLVGVTFLLSALSLSGCMSDGQSPPPNPFKGLGQDSAAQNDVATPPDDAGTVDDSVTPDDTATPPGVDGSGARDHHAPPPPAHPLPGGFKFGVFGDVRPPSEGADNAYPVDIITSIMSGMQSSGAQFAIGTGDYMYARSSSSVTNQLGQLVQAETNFSGKIYHARKPWA
jgi:hypothetical protein